jgi:hypothetical protein
LTERDHFEDPGVDGRQILRLSPGSGMVDMDWNELAKVRDRWWALMNAVMNLRVP